MYIVSLGNVCRWLGAAGRSARRRDLPRLRRRGGPLRRQRRGARRRDRRHGRRAATARTRASTSPAWSSTPSTRCSPKAAAARCRRSSCSSFNLRDGVDPQKYGIGIKELWEVAPDKHQKGLVLHSQGWPLDSDDRRRLVPLPLRRQPRRRSASSSTSTTRIRTCRRTTSSSASRRIRRSAARSKAASGSPTARARSTKAACNRCRSSRFPAAR